jgi:protein ImuA
VDEALPGGFPRGALSELRGGPASGKTGVALSLVAGLPQEELAAFVDGTGELYPPAAAALGVDLGRLLVVRPGDARSRPSLFAGGLPPPDGGLLAPLLARRAPDLGSSLRVAPGLWAAEALLSSGAFAAVIMDVPLAGVRGAEGILRRLQTAAEKGGAVGLWLSMPGERARAPSGVRLELSVRGGRVVARREGRGALARAGGDGHAA